MCVTTLSVWSSNHGFPTHPAGPNLPTSPGCNRKCFSISALVFSISSLMLRIFLISSARISVLPANVGRPRFSLSCSKARVYFSRAATTTSAGFVDGDGKICCRALAACEEGDVVVSVCVGANVEEGDQVGVGCTGPICESRDPKSGSRASSSMT